MALFHSTVKWKSSHFLVIKELSRVPKHLDPYSELTFFLDIFEIFIIDIEI